LFKTIFKKFYNSTNKKNLDSSLFAHKNYEDRLFNSIVGYSDIKKFLMRCIISKEQVHILFTGPPATSKTVFLLEMSTELSNSYFIDSTATSGIGIVDFLFSNPNIKFLLIDEIDKLTKKDQTVLYNLMETGILIILFYWKLNECYYSKVMLNDKFVG
jgi:DNA polymerase III delta prime subunit